MKEGNHKYTDKNKKISLERLSSCEKEINKGFNSEIKKRLEK